MRNVLLVINIIVSILVTVLILLQGKGAGLGSAWGGGGEMFQTRRGVEKLSLKLTIGLTVAFLLISVITLFVK